MKIIGRKEALALGLKRYFTGKVCPRGHIAERKTKNSSCLKCEREATALYQRKHPLSPQQAARKKEKARTRRTENPEKERERQKRWRESNPEARRQQDRRHYQRHYEKVRQAINNRNRKKAIALGIIKHLAENDPRLTQLMGEIDDALSG